MTTGPLPPSPEQVARALAQRRTPSQRVPLLRPTAVAAHRLRHRIRWAGTGVDWAARTPEPGPDCDHEVFSHRSPLLRELDPELMWLQHNKVHNLRLAAPRLDGLELRPGQWLSFNRAVGNCTRRAGYRPGLTLTGGRPAPGVGGGICQLANMLHWLVLHSPLTVVERSEHSVAPFPDRERVVPWGVGCTIVYNYVDLVVRNDTRDTFRLQLRVGDHDLVGRLSSDVPPRHTYQVRACHEGFWRVDGGPVVRSNQIWRTTRDRLTGEPLGTERISSTCARVAYPLDPATPVRPLPVSPGRSPAGAPPRP